MAIKYDREITVYLYDAYQADSLRHVPYGEIYTAIKPYSVQESLYYIDFTASIQFLIGKGCVEEEAAHYRLTSSGIEYANYILYPPTDYPKESLKTQKASNTITAISIGVAVVGLIFAFIQTHPIKSPPDPINKSWPIPLSVAITESGINARTIPLANWFDKTPQNPVIDGVSFLLSSDSPVIETESNNSSNPAKIIIPIQQNNVARINLLINLSYTNPIYVDGIDVTGINIADVCITDGSKQYCWPLIYGQDVRDWVIGSNKSINPLNNQVNPAWQAHHKNAGAIAVIDHLILIVPAEFSNVHINNIILQDKSMESFACKNPGIVLFGVTVEVK